MMDFLQEAAIRRGHHTLLRLPPVASLVLLQEVTELILAPMISCLFDGQKNYSCLSVGEGASF